MFYYFGIAILSICAIKLIMLLRNRYIVQPVLYYKDSKLSQYLLKNCKTLTKPFKPPAWLANNHVQTIVPAVLNKIFTHGVQFSRELIQVDDGENVALDWAYVSDNGEDHNERKCKDIIIILPGMTASAESFTSTCLVAMKSGFRVGVLNKRGHGKSKLSKPMLRGFADSTDVHSVLMKLKERHPDDKIALIGSSAGSALVGAYCNTYKDDDSYMDACIHLSPGYVVKELMTDPPFSWFYEYIFVQSLKQEIIYPNMECLSQVVDKHKVKSAKRIVDLEEHVYAKVNGYKDLNEYWEKNDLKDVWGAYSAPTLCVSGLDDPVCVKDNIPFDKFKLYGHGLLVTVEKGGHCGFIEDLSGNHWSDQVMVDYLQTVFAYLREEEVK